MPYARHMGNTQSRRLQMAAPLGVWLPAWGSAVVLRLLHTYPQLGFMFVCLLVILNFFFF